MNGNFKLYKTTLYKVDSLNTSLQHLPFKDLGFCVYMLDFLFIEKPPNSRKTILNVITWERKRAFWGRQKMQMFGRVIV